MIALRRIGDIVTVWACNDKRAIRFRALEITPVEKYGNPQINGNATDIQITFNGEYAEIRLKTKGALRVESSKGVWQSSGDSGIPAYI